MMSSFAHPHERGARNRWHTVVAAIALAVVFPRSALAADDATLADKVKAAYLLKLPQFVTWPPNSVLPQANTFNLCIVGESPLADMLTRAAAGEHVAGKPLAIERLEKADLSARCQVMYIAHDPQSAAQSLTTVAGNPVLTVTDSEQGEGSRGVVNFVMVSNRVRFEIDRSAADRNHLQISSKLLTIAAAVYPERSTP